MARYAKYGGVLLTATGVATGCYDIARAQSRQEKDEIFVENFAGTLTGIGSSAVLSIFLISNPVGWGVTLALGTGAALTSYGIGKGAKFLYTASGSKVDLVSGLGFDRLCR